MTDMLDAAHRQSGGLRERKKARTRASIREHALRLFHEQGYQATTVEQIAAAAEISPSTFFRYFPTKEDVILQDDLDTLMAEAFARQPAGLSPIAAMRAAIRDVVPAMTPVQWEQVRAAAALTMVVPEIRARAMDEFARTIQVMAEAIAKRAGHDPNDMSVRVLAGAIVGVIMSVTLPWADWHEDHLNAEMFDRIDAALALLERGLPLEAG